jgi:hypothetical protein
MNKYALPDSFLVRELRILKLKEMADKAFFGFMKKGHLRDAAWLESEQETELMKELPKLDEILGKLIQENSQLISNTQIDFAVAKESMSTHSAYAKHLVGNIHANGYLYLETENTNFFNTTAFPVLYSGLINALGDSTAFAAKTDYRILGSRVPQRFIGDISLEGEMEFKTTDSFWEMDGNIFVSRIIADPFKGDGNKTELFLENREQIKERISEVREDLLG